MALVVPVFEKNINLKNNDLENDNLKNKSDEEKVGGESREEGKNQEKN